jgi:amidase
MRHTSLPNAYKSQRSISTICHPFVVVATVTMLLLTYYWTAFVVSAAVVPLVAAHGKKATLPSLLDATFHELTAGLECGSFSSVDLVDVSNAPAPTSSGSCNLCEIGAEADNTGKAYFERILQVNSSLHVVTEINPDAWEIAQELDQERAAGKCRGYGLVAHTLRPAS